MMGTKARAFAPLCNRSIEDLVPAGNFYRHLETKRDLSFVRDLVRGTYREGDRPSIDPVVFFRLQLVMLSEGLRSERELLRVAADRLSVRWYLEYDLDEELPDHLSLTRIRQRYGRAVFRRFFEAVVEQCREAGLVWGKELYFDATQVKANASLDSIAPRFAVEAHLGELFTDEGADEVASVDDENQPTELPIPITDTPRASSSTALTPPIATRARSRWPAPKAARVARFIGPCTPSTSIARAYPDGGLREGDGQAEGLGRAPLRRSEGLAQPRTVPTSQTLEGQR
jgi:transposase